MDSSPTVANSVYVTLDLGVHEHMYRAGGQSHAKLLVLRSQASLILIYRPTEGMDQNPSHSSPAQGLNLRHVVWKLDTLVTKPLGGDYRF
ncbi:hypothetical protein TNCV_1298891 [Trichonephila clavipes]|nr:hypothetical protein TNCV_1298891 [Trichonephila clavipes]